MPSLETLAWYARRLSRMSLAELVHRATEQTHRRQDRARRFGWEAFGSWEGAVTGLPGFSPTAVAGLVDRAVPLAEAAEAGRFTLLSQAWPRPNGPQVWWRGGAWFLDPVSGKAWPGADRFAFDVPYRHEHERGDVKFVWELNRLQFLPPMALGGRAGAAWDALDGWMDANPPYRGINWTGGIEAASRLVSVLALQAISPCPAAFAHRLRAFVESHAHWIARYPSRFSSANNHRVAELAALFLAAACAPHMPRAAAHAREGREGLEHEASLQFHDDGIGAEQSPTYAAYSLEWFALAGVVAEATGAPLSEAFRARLAKAADALGAFLDDGGHAPRIGDDDEGRVLALTQGPEDDYPRSVAALTHRWLGRPVTGGARSPELRDGLCAGREATAAAAVGTLVFPEGGYTVWRSPTPRGMALLVFDHAPLGFLSIAAHGHADALAVWLHWGEEAVIADAGTFLYHSGGGDRDRFRGTLAHNTLSIGDEDQSRIAGAFNWSAHAQARSVESAVAGAVAAEHDGYRRRFGVVHRRDVAVDGLRMTLTDRLTGTPSRPGLTWSSGLTLGPGVSAVVVGGEATVTTPAGRRLTLTAGGAEWALQAAPYSPAFNRRADTLRLVLTGEVDARASDGQVAAVTIALL